MKKEVLERLDVTLGRAYKLFYDIIKDEIDITNYETYEYGGDFSFQYESQLLFKFRYHFLKRYFILHIIRPGHMDKKFHLDYSNYNSSLIIDNLETCGFEKQLLDITKLVAIAMKENNNIIVKENEH